MTMGRLSVSACAKAANNSCQRSSKSFLKFALGNTRNRETMGKRGGEVARLGIGSNVLGAIVYARYVDLKREVWGSSLEVFVTRRNSIWRLRRD